VDLFSVIKWIRFRLTKTAPVVPEVTRGEVQLELYDQLLQGGAP
jgi:hypothetical protein